MIILFHQVAVSFLSYLCIDLKEKYD